MNPSHRASGSSPGGTRRRELAEFAGFLRPFRGRLTIATALSLLQSAVALAQPWPVKLAIDHALGGRPLTGVLSPLRHLRPGQLAGVAALLTILIVAVGGLLGFVRTLVVARVGEALGADLREAALARALAQPATFHARHGSGDLLSRCSSDVETVKRALLALCLGVVPPVATVVGVLVVLFRIDRSLSLVGLGSLPVLVVLNLWRGRRARQVELLARDQGGVLLTEAVAQLRGFQTIQVYDRADLARDRFRTRSRELERTGRRAARVVGAFGPVTELTLAVGGALTLWLGMRSVLAGALPVGTLIVLMSYLGSVLGPAQQLADLVPALLQASASFERVADVLRTDDVIRSWPWSRPAGPLQRSISCRGLSFGYAPGQEVLQDLDLTIDAGSRVCIVGTSGAGKSTLLELMLRLREPTSGSIWFDDGRLGDFELTSLRRQFAFVPQEPWLVEGTVAANIALGDPAAAPERIERAARLAGLHVVASGWVDGLDHEVGEGGCRLSVGQRLRVAIARALVADPSVLVLDEPTSSLDANGERAFLDSLDEAAVGRTVVVVSHRLQVAEWAERVVVLDRGGIVEDGSPEVLGDSDGPYAALLRSASGAAAHASVTSIVPGTAGRGVNRPRDGRRTARVGAA